MKNFWQMIRKFSNSFYLLMKNILLKISILQKLFEKKIYVKNLHNLKPQSLLVLYFGLKEFR